MPTCSIPHPAFESFLEVSKLLRRVYTTFLPTRIWIMGLLLTFSLAKHPSKLWTSSFLNHFLVIKYNVEILYDISYINHKYHCTLLVFGPSIAFLCPSFQLPTVSVPLHYSRFSAFVWYICCIINNKICNLYSVSIPNTHTSMFGSRCCIGEKSMQHLSFWLWFICFHTMMSSSMYFPSYDITLLYFMTVWKKRQHICATHFLYPFVCWKGA